MKIFNVDLDDLPIISNENLLLWDNWFNRHIDLVGEFKKERYLQMKEALKMIKAEREKRGV